jgi:hypothetical protein
MQRYSQTELTDYGRQLYQVNARFAMDRILNTGLTPAQSLSLINDTINENGGKIFKINENNRLVFLDDNLQTQVLATLAENERARVATIAANATGANSANSLGSVSQFMDDIRNLSGQPRRRGGKSRKSRKGKSRKNHKKSNRTRR